MNIVEYADNDMLAMGLANALAGDLRVALGHQDRVLLVVPGGTTPGPVFDALCAADLDWSRVDVLPSDERWLPQAHVRSNARLIRNRLMVGRAAAARLLPLYSPAAERPEEALQALSAAITPRLPVAVSLLGMGTDMHVASLFAGAEGLQQALARDAPVLVALRAQGVPEPRVSLSARVLAGAVCSHIVITGRAKRRALDAARNRPPEEAPVAAVLEDATVHWAEEAAPDNAG